MAVDSRATGGQYIGSQSVRKVVEINDLLLGTLAGGAADCTYWYRVLTSECRLYELRNKKKISLAAATKIMNNIIYSYKNSGLSMGMILAGGDMKQVSLYYLDSDGTRTTGKIFSVGSGSLFAYGVLDSGYRWDMTDDEAHGKKTTILTNMSNHLVTKLLSFIHRAWSPIHLPCHLPRCLLRRNRSCLSRQKRRLEFDFRARLLGTSSPLPGGKEEINQLFH